MLPFSSRRSAEALDLLTKLSNVTIGTTGCWPVVRGQGWLCRDLPGDEIAGIGWKILKSLAGPTLEAMGWGKICARSLLHTMAASMAFGIAVTVMAYLSGRPAPKSHDRIG
jgi:hypothetical protein